MTTTTALLCDTAEILRPPRRLSVTQTASQYLHISLPGGHHGLWSAELTPYLIEPMNLLTSRRHDAIAFVGPARSGKTLGLIEGWLTHIVCCDPGDTLIVQMSQEAARDYSRLRIDRAIRHSPELRLRLSPHGHDNNIHDKTFRSGMILKIAWPSVSQLSSKDIRYVALTDYDRMPEDIDGEGDAFSLARKRTQTFLSAGMTLVESSPGRVVEDTTWTPKTLHEAPPTSGIMALYNQGDRRRWYWPCPECGQWFEASPGLTCFRLLPDRDKLEELILDGAELPTLARSYAKVICENCGAVIVPQQKRALNAAGRWLSESDQPNRVASYWLGGVAAAYQSWESILLLYLQALREYLQTGTTEALKATTTVDQGAPFTNLRRAKEIDHHELERLAEEWELDTVPAGVRFLVMTIDVQQNRFVCQVHGWGPGLEGWLIDRFSVRQSTRRDSHGEPLPVQPTTYAEDWDLLTPLLGKHYRCADQPEREFGIQMIGCDTGGSQGVTQHAYAYWRRLRREGLHRRFLLLKGDGRHSAPLLKLTYPDDRRRRDRSAGARGEVPLLLLNVNALKDANAVSLQRPTPGPGYMHWPRWLRSGFFHELSAEVRDPKGIWQKLSHRHRNEAWDLWTYARALALYLGADKVDWSRPPAWAQLVQTVAESIPKRPKSGVQSPLLGSTEWQARW